MNEGRTSAYHFTQALNLGNAQVRGLNEGIANTHKTMVKGISEVSAAQMQQLSSTTDLVIEIQSNLNQTWDIGNEKIAEVLGEFVSLPRLVSGIPH